MLGVRQSDTQDPYFGRHQCGPLQMRRSAARARVAWEGGVGLTTASHGSSDALSERRRLFSQVLVHEMWASLAIAVMWLAVLFDALFGPDLVVSNASGTTTIPSAIIVAFFAYLATRVVARYGFLRAGDTD